MIVATAGHVDHGKTLLVHALTGVDTDRLPEERARGMTIELGFAYRDLGDGRTTGFVDVPGHERFIRTMVAGVAGIDVVLFVIAADDGPMPQTAEHLAILDLLGVTRGVVALSKCDRVSPERVAEVRDVIAALLAPTGLADTPIVPVSAVTGAGVDTLRMSLLAHQAALPARDVSGNFRLAVDRSFVLKGAGRVVTGTIFSGAVAAGDVVCHAPGGGELRVRTLHAQNHAADAAHAGQRCALNVAGSGLRDGDISRGDWMVAPAAHFGTRRFDAEIRVVDSEARPLANRTAVHVHVGAADATGRLVMHDETSITPGGSGLVQVLLDRDLHLVRGDGVILRDQSARRTVGGGVVLDPLPDMRGRNRAERARYLAAMRVGDAGASLAQALATAGAGVELERFRHAWNLTPAAFEALCADAALARYGPPAAPSAVTLERWTALGEDISSALAAAHVAAPAAVGVSGTAIRRALPARVELALFNARVEALVEAGAVLREGGLLRLPQHRPARDTKDEALWQRVEPLLGARDGKVPVVHDLAQTLGLAPAALENYLGRAAQYGWVVRLSAKRYFLPAMLERYAAIVRELAIAAPRGFSAAAFRDAAGIGRNAVIEILEYFDRIGLTKRQGEVRIVLKGRSGS